MSVWWKITYFEEFSENVLGVNKALKHVDTSIREFFSIRLRIFLFQEPVVLFIRSFFKWSLFILSAAESNRLSDKQMQNTNNNFAHITEIKVALERKPMTMK